MKQKMRFLLIAIITLSLENLCANSQNEMTTSSEDGIKVFQYSQLAEKGPEMTAEFKRVGYIAIDGVPEFEEAYQQFQGASNKFVKLSEADQAKCTPSNYAARGWSRGVEVFNGHRDTYKGSYYAAIPDDGTNIWPEEILPELKDAYQNVAMMVLNVAREVLPLIGFDHEIQALGRMLDYQAVPEGANDGNPNWCGNHRDHGVFTGLCPEVYYNDAGEVVVRPEGSGLYIEGRPVAPPRNLMLFQMGEFMELMTNGAVRATDHWVQKAPSGYRRSTLAVFIDPLDEITVTCTDEAVKEKYADRYADGITYEEWGNRSLAKYNPKNLAPSTVEEV